jgi:NAD(P)-dependent dehydrogenase (short-subunit alcohol dehydrogenase family)
MNSDEMVIISGGAGHLGQAVAHWWAKRGAQIVLIDCDAGRLDNCVARLRRLGSNVVPVAADMTNPAAFVTVFAEFGASVYPSSLVVTHGIAGRRAGDTLGLTGLTRHGWREVLDVNLTSVVFAVQAVVPLMRKGGGGRIVLVSSTAGLSASPTTRSRTRQGRCPYKCSRSRQA